MSPPGILRKNIEEQGVIKAALTMENLHSTVSSNVASRVRHNYTESKNNSPRRDNCRNLDLKNSKDTRSRKRVVTSSPENDNSMSSVAVEHKFKKRRSTDNLLKNLN